MSETPIERIERELRERIGSEFDGEATLSEAEALALLDALSRQREALEKAYGILWRDVTGLSAEKCRAARKELLAVLTKEGQKRGIEHALSVYGPTTESEILAIDDAPQPDECPECHKYLGKCPYCHRPRPSLAARALQRNDNG